jgi:pYEATS domain-containing protein involved in immunity
VADRDQSKAKSDGAQPAEGANRGDAEHQPNPLPNGPENRQRENGAALGVKDECDDSVAEPRCRRFPIRIEHPQGCFKILGLTDVDQARIALSTLAADVRIDDLRVFYESEVSKETRPEESNESPSDPNKGKFGECAVSNHRQLSATVVRSLTSGLSTIRLSVSSTDPEKYKLTGLVNFVLHPTFEPSQVKVEPENNVAELEIDAWGAFTVGAIADGGRTRLELDLASVVGAEESFYKR